MKAQQVMSTVGRVHSPERKCTLVPRLPVTPQQVLPINDHYASDHLSSHNGEGTGGPAGLVLCHVLPPFLRGQAGVRHSTQQAVYCPSLDISFALMDNACLVLSNAKDLLVSRAALASPCKCFLRRRVGQLFLMNPVGITPVILIAAPFSPLGPVRVREWTKRTKRNAFSPNGNIAPGRIALSPSNCAENAAVDDVRSGQNQNHTRVSSVNRTDAG